MKYPYSKRASIVLGLCGLSLVPLGCKDDDPCDPGQEFVAIGCFPINGGGAGKSSTGPAAGGAEDAGGAAGVEPSSPGGASGTEPSGNPDAIFGTTCATNDDCGGDARVCLTDPLFYCSQIDCQDGEPNAGSCPPGWTCFKYLDNPSACVNPSSF